MLRGCLVYACVGVGDRSVVGFVLVAGKWVSYGFGVSHTVDDIVNYTGTYTVDGTED